MTNTIDSIVTEVFRNLGETREGQTRVGGTDRLVTRLNAAAASLREKRAQLRPRPGMSFSVNTTQAQRDPLTISVRVHGVDCGFVVFEKTERMFEPSPNFIKWWSSDRKTSDQRALEWGKAGVATFIKACGDDADSKQYGRRESSIQELLFRAMQGGGKKKTGILRGFQPIFFGGVPIQIPLPVAPRGGSDELGKHQGHSDVLARGMPQGQLVVFEVKRPAASRTECIEAPEQAVRYAAALDYLMGRDDHRAAYWRLFGSKRGLQHRPTFSAVAFLDATRGTAYERDLHVTLDRLRSGNKKKGYFLRVMLYRAGVNTIEVVSVM